MKDQIIRFLQLPFYFDAARLACEVDAVDAAWQLHFNTRDYEGHWAGIALRSPGGSAGNLLTEETSTGSTAVFEDTPLMDQCPYLKEVLEQLQCPQQSVRLLKLERGAVIKEHTDQELSFEKGEARIHIPVITHDEVEFYLDGERLRMRAGECWYMNAHLPHRLANPSPVDRIHLVVDCRVNDWLTAQFEQPGLPVKSMKDVSAENRDTQRQIIRLLRESGDPARMEMALNMEQEMQELPAVKAEEKTEDLVERIIAFIRSVGIAVSFATLADNCFLPGISIEKGAIVIDTGRLLYPGDLLHEAGHIAVVPEAERAGLNAETIGARHDRAAEEMMAIAWSYAAVCQLGLAAEVVFHPDGYQGGAENIIAGLCSDVPLGLPMLQYAGMALTKPAAAAQGRAPYPTMLRWTRV